MFDPYYKWLGIPPKDQPPNHYRLLGIELFEADPDVIDTAANKQMAYIQGCANGPHLPLSQKLLNEIAAARLCLLDPKKKVAYDAALKTSLPKLALATPVSASPSVSSQLRVITADSQAPASPKSSQHDRESFDTLASQPAFGIPKPRKRQSKKWPVILGGFLLGVIGLVIVAVYSLGILNPAKTDKPHAELPGKKTPEQTKEKSRKLDEGLITSGDPLGEKLKKHFQGTASYSPKTGVLILVYDFKDKKELKDFELNDTKTSIANGILELKGGDIITHVVNFETVAVTGVMGINKDRNSERIKTTTGAVLGTTHVNDQSYLSMRHSGNETAFDKIQAMTAPFEFTVAPKRVTMKWGKTVQLVNETKETLGGQVQLVGGTNGTQFQRLVLTGKLNPEWAKKLFSGP